MGLRRVVQRFLGAGGRNEVAEVRPPRDPVRCLELTDQIGGVVATRFCADFPPDKGFVNKESQPDLIAAYVGKWLLFAAVESFQGIGEANGHTTAVRYAELLREHYADQHRTVHRRIGGQEGAIPPASDPFDTFKDCESEAFPVTIALAQQRTLDLIMEESFLDSPAGAANRLNVLVWAGLEQLAHRLAFQNPYELLPES